MTYFVEGVLLGVGWWLTVRGIAVERNPAPTHESSRAPGVPIHFVPPEGLTITDCYWAARPHPRGDA